MESWHRVSGMGAAHRDFSRFSNSPCWHRAEFKSTAPSTILGSAPSVLQILGRIHVKPYEKGHRLLLQVSHRMENGGRAPGAGFGRLLVLPCAWSLPLHLQLSCSSPEAMTTALQSRVYQLHSSKCSDRCNNSLLLVSRGAPIFTSNRTRSKLC